MEDASLRNSDKQAESSGIASTRRNRYRFCSENGLMWVICVLYTISSLRLVVVLPLYISGTEMAGGDPYAMLLYVCSNIPVVLTVFAVLYKYFFDASASLAPVYPCRVLSFGGVLFALASLGICTTGSHRRTPSHLQGILVAMRIPYTVGVRFLWLRKGSLYVLSSLGLVVTLPLAVSSTKAAKGCPYAMILIVTLVSPVFFTILTAVIRYLCNGPVSLAPISPWWVTCFGGAMYTLTGLGISITGLPERTPSHLQGILVSMKIPYTVVIRILWLWKGLSPRRLVCTVILLIGVFISLEPRIWSLPGSKSQPLQQEEEESFAGSTVVWPVLFSLSYLPLAFVAVLCERELKKEDAQPLNFILWIQIFQVLTLLSFFWIDVFPYVGTAKSFGEVFDHIGREFSCHFSSEESCHGLALKGWIYILSYCLSNLLQFLLIQRAEGAVFTMIVQSVVTPLSTLFWTFLRFDEASNRLSWGPEFTMTTGFTLLGLVIIVPAVVMYNVFSRWDAKEEQAAPVDATTAPPTTTPPPPPAVVAVNGVQVNGDVPCKIVNYNSFVEKHSR
ncbi:hypothetical protein ACOMHN_010562 [Nucella lapillus]